MAPVAFELVEGVALITLDRPEARNAIDSSMAEGIIDAARRAEQSSDVRVVVLTGADPSFCSGVDLKEVNRTGLLPPRASEAILAFANLTKPTLGAINGPAVAGGLELALGLDFLIASPRATVVDTHAKVGILPASGLTSRLPEAVGPGRAREMSFTGRVVGAREAVSMGLVNRVVRHRRLLPEAMTSAKLMASRDPAVLVRLKALYRGDRMEPQ